MAKKKEKKEKKAGKRMSKKELAALLIDFFHAKSSEILSMKYIFSELRLTTHPQKMLCVDILHDLLDDDYISEIEKGKFRLNNHGTEMIGTFQRKSNGKNSFIPEEGGEPVFVAERNSAHAMNNDKVKITFYAKRKNREAEGEVIEILERANDTFVGTLEAVSYTHLDVYKRQPPHWRYLTGWKDAPPALSDGHNSSLPHQLQSPQKFPLPWLHRQ